MTAEDMVNKLTAITTTHSNIQFNRFMGYPS